jgi:alkylhydroperoxidase family enzyme
MFDKLIANGLSRFEREVGVPGSADYLRAIARQSKRAFAKFLLILPLARHRRAVSIPAYFAARISAVLAQDCGICVQMETNMARQHGVPPEVLRAVLEDRMDRLPPEVAAAHQFARAVAGRTENEGALREQVRRYFGEEGLVELALAIATAMVFPVTKRALGYATACALVNVEIEP